jgi:hypothetical protein
MYVATITNAVKDLSGNQIVSNYTWSFTTGTQATINQIGINIDAPADYSENRLYADVIKSSRGFISGSNVNGSTFVAVDANGWPTGDFSFYVWSGIQNMYGTYTLTFNGKANVTSNPGGILTTTYNSANNTSTGTLIFMPAWEPSPSTLTLSFANTQQSSSSATNTGVTNIQLMRPTSVGASTSYPAGTLFNSGTIQSLISKFSVIRFMDFLATNWNVQTNWADRPLPSWASFNRCGSGNGLATSTVLCTKTLTNGGGYGWEGIGGPLEHVILLANTTNKDPWINIPINATDAYITNVANLFAYGSDASGTPYTSTVANPVYPPLNSNLNLYIEYSNEVWNSSFAQFAVNCTLASNELSTGLTASGSATVINWDGAWNSNTYPNANWVWPMCNRHTTERTVQISNIFRGVFGDAAMGSRIRPVLESQLGGSASGFDEATMLLNYYDNLAVTGGSSSPHPPSYYIYGAGGSGYYSPATTVSSLDTFFTDPGFIFGTGSTVAPEFIADVQYTAAMGVKRIAYEGGPGLDTITGAARNSISPQAILDPRMKSTMVGMHNMWSNNGGDLFVYFTSTGDYQWGFTNDIFNLATYKLQAIDALNSTSRAAVTFGTAVPGSVSASVSSGVYADMCSRGWGCNPMNTSDQFVTTIGSNYINWASFCFNSTSSSPKQWTVNLTYISASSPTVAVYIDGVLIGSGSALSYTSTGLIGSGLHSVIVKATSGSFKLGSLAVTQN